MMKFICGTLFNVLMGVILAYVVGVNPAYGAATGAVVPAVLGNFMPAGSVFEGVYTEVWTGELIKRLNAGLKADWLNGIPDYSAKVDNEVIHLVDVGGDPDVLVNNTTYPIPIQDLTESDVPVGLDKFQTKATRVTDDQLYALSFDKFSADVERHGNAITSLKPDYPVITTHWHEEAEFTLITEGDASYQIDLTSYAVEKDDLIFIPPLLLHSVSRGQSALYQSETYVFHMNFLGGNATDICSTRYLMPLTNEELSVPCLIRPTHPAYVSLRKIFAQISSLFANPVEGYELAIKALLLQVIFLLLQNRTPDGKRSVDTANASEKLKTVLDYIHLHYAEPLTVAGLAAQCYFSEYYFMRFFKKHMNMTVVEYLNNLRLEKAVELFEQGNTSILEVSLATGFHNLSYFHKIFKRKFHMTPREFLKKLSSF